MDDGKLVSGLGKGELGQDEQQEWQRTIQNLSPDDFRQVVTDLVRETDWRQFTDMQDPGPESIHNLGQPEQAALEKRILKALARRGIAAAEMRQSAGVQPAPGQTRTAGLGRLVVWLQSNHPDVIGEVAADYIAQPNLLVHLIGNQNLQALIANLRQSSRGGTGEAA